MDSRAHSPGPDGHSQETMRARLGVRDSTSALFALGSLTPRLPRARSGTSATHHDGRHRRPPRPSDGRLGEHFHFHTTRLKGFRSPETPHFDLPWNLPDSGRLPPEDEERGWSGSFLYRFLETPRLSRKMKGLGKSSGTALLWESRHHGMRMHYIGGRVLRDFYVTAVIAAGGGSKGWGPSRGGRHDAGGFLPAIRMLVVAPSAPSGARGLPKELQESAFDSGRLKDGHGLKRAGNSRTPRAGRFTPLPANRRPEPLPHVTIQTAGDAWIRRPLQPQNRPSTVRVL